MGFLMSLSLNTKTGNTNNAIYDPAKLSLFHLIEAKCSKSDVVLNMVIGLNAVPSTLKGHTWRNGAFYLFFTSTAAFNLEMCVLRSLPFKYSLV